MNFCGEQLKRNLGFLVGIICALVGADVSYAKVVSLKYVDDALAGKQAAGDYALKSELPTVPTKVSELENDSAFITDAALATYATTEAMNAALAGKAEASALSEHVANKENPHSVTKAQVGLGNVQDVDQTNANNLTSGTVSYARLPVGSAANTVAAGDDARFNTIPTSQPSGTPPAGHVFVWFN